MTSETISLASPDEIHATPPERSRAFMFVKRCVQEIARIWITPRLVAFALSRALLGSRSFSAASESIAKIPGLPGVLCRQAFYRSLLEYCGHDVFFGWQSVFSMTQARVGSHAYIGRFCSIGFAEIGENVMIADGVQLLSGGREHGRGAASDESMQDQMQTFRRIFVGRGAWIGAGAIIMADVGEGAIVGAGAVVNKPIPAHCVAVGAPARIVKKL